MAKDVAKPAGASQVASDTKIGSDAKTRLGLENIVKTEVKRLTTDGKLELNALFDDGKTRVIRLGNEQMNQLLGNYLKNRIGFSSDYLSPDAMGKFARQLIENLEAAKPALSENNYRKLAQIKDFQQESAKPRDSQSDEEQHVSGIGSHALTADDMDLLKGITNGRTDQDAQQKAILGHIRAITGNALGWPSATELVAQWLEQQE